MEIVEDGAPAARGKKPKAKAEKVLPKPQEIKAHLDEYVTV